MIWSGLKMSKQKVLTAAYYRGGTSRAIIFERKNLPSDERKWPLIFQKIMGSPDPNGRQLDGLGAGISSLSKVCVVAPSKDPNADIDYTFYAVGVKEDEVDTAGNCGNMSAAIGPYAFDHKMLNFTVKQDSTTEVRILQTNTDKVIRSTFSTTGDEAEVEGDFSIDGVEGSGSCINLEFINPGGSKTGNTLPTGNIVDNIHGLEVTCLDVGNPCVFVRATDFGLESPILPDDMLKLPDLLERIENLRHAVAVKIGLIEKDQGPPRTVPKVGIVSRPVEHRILSGNKLQADEVDVVIRMISDRQPHRAIPLTATVCSAAAAKLEGSIVEQCLRRPFVKPDVLTIGHTSGKIPAMASVTSSGEIESVTVFRTARRLMEGNVYYS